MRDNYPPTFTADNEIPSLQQPGQQHVNPHGAGGATTAASHALGGGGAGPPPPVAARKPKRHRKRHPPVGPAGVWFQNFHQQSADGRPVKLSLMNKQTNDGGGKSEDNEEEEEEEDNEDTLQNLRRSLQQRYSSGHDPSDALAECFQSGAWTNMQMEFQWLPPSLPLHLTVAERYPRLRPFLPAEFTMIYEIIHPSVAINGYSRKNPWLCENLMVLVASIHSSATAHGWTATLTDETGAALTAWIEPESVRRQLQRRVVGGGSGDAASSNKTWFRTGSVLWLHNTCLLLSPDFYSPSASETGEQRVLSFMLLVGEDNIKQVWTDDNCSDIMFTQWMERRSQVAQGQGGHGGDDGDNDDMFRATSRASSSQTERGNSPRFSPTRSSFIQQTQTKNRSPRHSTREKHLPQNREHPTVSQLNVSTQSQSSRHLQPTRDGPPAQYLPPPQRHSHQRLAPHGLHSPSLTREQMPARATQSTVSRPNPFAHATYDPPVQSPLPLQQQQQHHSRQPDISYDTDTQPTLTPSARPLNVSTVASSSRRHASGAIASRFASFAHSPEPSTATQTNHLDQSSNMPVRRDMEQRRRPSSNNRETSPVLTQQSNHDAQITSTQETPAPRRSKPNIRTATTSSKKQRQSSSSRKRKRRATTSKLWTGAVSLDFSDEEDDDEGVTGSTNAQQTQKPPKSNQDPPPMKRSLFRQNGLQDLANLLSSDDEDVESND